MRSIAGMPASQERRVVVEDRVLRRGGKTDADARRARGRRAQLRPQRARSSCPRAAGAGPCSRRSRAAPSPGSRRGVALHVGREPRSASRVEVGRSPGGSSSPSKSTKRIARALAGALAPRAAPRASSITAAVPAAPSLAPTKPLRVALACRSGRRGRSPGPARAATPTTLRSARLARHVLEAAVGQQRAQPLGERAAAAASPPGRWPTRDLAARSARTRAARRSGSTARPGPARPAGRRCDAARGAARRRHRRSAGSR